MRAFVEDFAEPNESTPRKRSRRPWEWQRLDPWEGLVWATGLATSIWQVARTDASAWAWGPPALIVVALFVRRRHPILAVAIACCAALGAAVTGGDGLLSALGAQSILFSATLTLGRARSIVPAIALGIAVYGSVVLGGGEMLAGASLATFSWTLGVWGIAVAIYSQRESLRQWKGRAHRAERRRADELRRTIVEERLRIARDLHDELAHQIAVISMNAGAAELALDHDEDGARRALVRVRTASRGVLEELQQILGVLRTDGDAAPADASAAEVAALIESARSIGLEVTAPVIDLATLPLDGRLAAYRAIQECLTNARRHGVGALALALQVDERARTWAMTARNALDPARTGTAPGFGLVGMRERVEQAGGELIIDETDGEFRLHIELPLAIGGPS